MVLNIAVVAVIVLLDQLTKYLTVVYVKPAGTIPIIAGAVHLTYAENRGASFSILQGQRTLFIVITLITVAAIIIYMALNRGKTPALLRTALVFVAGGALGNFIDRLTLGYVIDMIDFRIINYAIFNVADSFVVIGAAMLLIYALFFEGGRPKKGKRSAAGPDSGSMGNDDDTERI